MHTPLPRSRLTRFFAFFLGAISLLTPGVAQVPGAGTVEGRVQNAALGDYLNNARVSVDGTTLTTFTNQFGEYRLRDVPAGTAKVTVFYSGLPLETATVTVAAGQTTAKDFDLKPSALGETVRLDAVTVSTSREMSGATIAANEQRFSPNPKTVMSADTFGDQSENNVAEFLKLMPAISIEYVAQDARNASIRGMPAHTTIVTKNGNQIASAASSGTSRIFEFEQVSINNIARLEVNKSLLPDMPAEGIGGTINLVTKSAFERSRPHFGYRGFFNANSTALDLKRTPGPGRESTHKIKPGFDFSYIRPVSKNFGFTVSGSLSSKYNPQYFADRTFDLNPNAAAGTENPALRSFQVQDGPKYTDRASGAFTVDWRFAPHDVLKLGFSEEYYRAMTTNRNLSINTGATPASFSPTTVQGRAGAGSGSHQNSMREKTGTTWTPELTYTHNGPVWKWEASGAYSHASNYYRDIDNGHFANFSLTMAVPNAAGTALVTPTIRFDGIDRNYLPDVVAVNGLGQAIDPYDLNQYNFASANGSRRTSADIKQTVRAHVQRRFDVFQLPITVKAGGDVRESTRDIRRRDYTYTFLGADGRAGTADNNAGRLGLIDERYTSVGPIYGLPASFQWPSAYKMWDLYVANPAAWTIDEVGAHRTEVQNSKHVVETITSGFVRLDTALFRNRLLFAGGLRYQKYDIYSESGLQNDRALFQQNAAGDLVLDAAGRPIRRTGTPLELIQLQFVERGAVSDTSGKGRYFPSAQLTYRITDDFQLRAGFANSINYPDLGEITASTTVSDPTVAAPIIVINPTALQPWFAHNYDFDIEYYTPKGGSVTLSFFRKDISNFINQIVYLPTTAGWADRLRANGFDPADFPGYSFSEKYNGGEVRVQGWEFAANQPLQEFLPGWGRGVSVFFNTSYKSAPKGARAVDVEAASKRRMNWGVTFHRGRLGASLKWNHVPPPKLITWAGVIDRPNSRTYLDVDVSLRFSRRFALFASGTNVTNVPQVLYTMSRVTPEFARRKEYHNHGIQMIAGVKGEF